MRSELSESSAHVDGPSRPHRSPAGTYEKIRKDVLEDPSLTNAEFRVLMYAATKPPGWVLRPRQIAEALERPLRQVQDALAGLRRKGYTVIIEERGEGQRWTSRETSLCRERVICPTTQEATVWVPAATSKNGLGSDEGLDHRPPSLRDGAGEEHQLAIVAALMGEVLLCPVDDRHRPVISYLRRTILRSGQRQVRDFASYARACLEREPARWYGLAAEAANGTFSDQGKYGFVSDVDTYEDTVPGLLRGEPGCVERWLDSGRPEPAQAEHAARLLALDDAA